MVTVATQLLPSVSVSSVQRMDRRQLIALTPEEQRQFLEHERTIILCSHGPHGYPHAVAMWFFVADDGSIWMTTYRKSQKAVNLRRNPKVALQADSGETYDKLKGVLIRGDAELTEDEDTCLNVLKKIHQKMSGSFPEGIDDAMRAQARKRVAIRVVPKRVSSWDHSKLGGAY
jgi:PPOX class probable F420-dependent enzyme